jgi:hypothetical protein
MNNDGSCQGADLLTISEGARVTVCQLDVGPMVVD